MSCRVFAEAIGGACWLEHTRTFLDDGDGPTGSEFRFALPGCLVDRGKEHRIVELPVVDSGVINIPNPLRVVVVEDSLMLRRMVKAKFTAVAAAAGIVDLTVVEHPTVESLLPHMHTFDDRTIITVDHNLDSQGGVLKGSDLIAALRNAGFKGLIISCSGDIEVAQQHLDLGADLVWGKPFPSIQVLLDSLVNFFTDHRILFPSPPSSPGLDDTPAMSPSYPDVIVELPATPVS